MELMRQLLVLRVNDYNMRYMSKFILILGLIKATFLSSYKITNFQSNQVFFNFLAS